MHTVRQVTSGVPQRSVLVGLSPEEGQERDKSAGAPSIKTQAEKVGTVPPGGREGCVETSQQPSNI